MVLRLTSNSSSNLATEICHLLVDVLEEVLNGILRPEYHSLSGMCCQSQNPLVRIVAGFGSDLALNAEMIQTKKNRQEACKGHKTVLKYKIWSLPQIKKLHFVIILLGKEMTSMKYEKPVIVAQSTVQMAECRPNSKPSGRPCNPPGPGGR